MWNGMVITAAIDWDLLIQKLNNLKDPMAGPVEIPVYDFVSHSRCLSLLDSRVFDYNEPVATTSTRLSFRVKQTQSVYGADVILLEGILIFHKVY